VKQTNAGNGSVKGPASARARQSQPVDAAAQSNDGVSFPAPGVQVRTRHISDYKSDPNNARRHNERNVGMIVEAIHEVGVGRSIVVTDDDVIRAGNGTTDAAIEAGITRVIEVETDGNTLVAVKRRNLSDEQKARLGIFDNRAAELATWDRDVIRKLADENPQALRGMFSEDELADLLAVTTEEDAEDGDGEKESVLDQAVQLRPAREYVVIVCAEGEKGADEFERLKVALGLGVVRRGGYKHGSPFDATGTQRVVPASEFLKRVDA
jgi:hypothetical protein